MYVRVRACACAKERCTLTHTHTHGHTHTHTHTLSLLAVVGQPTALKGTLVDTLKQVRPTLFLGVPRVWEKIEEKMKSVGAQTTGLKKKIGTWAKRKGLSGSYRIQRGQSTPAGWGVANKCVLSTRQHAWTGVARVCESV